MGVVSASSMTEGEKVKVASMEKDKGNEVSGAATAAAMVQFSSIASNGGLVLLEVGLEADGCVFMCDCRHSRRGTSGRRCPITRAVFSCTRRSPHATTEL